MVAPVVAQSPSKKTVRIMFISDTHNKHRDLLLPENVDILIHAGDFTLRGKEHEVKDFSNWLGEVPIKHKIVVAGNHDLCFQDNPVQAR